MTTLIGSDLDRTLVYSRAAVQRYGDGGAALVPVERYQDTDASWMTTAAAAALAGLARSALVVPVTTRTPEQYGRLRLPGPAPRFAVCANGGVLLVDGLPDAAWERSVKVALDEVTALPEVSHRVQASLPAGSRFRVAHDLFCYAVVERDALPDGFVTEASAWARERGWQVSLQGRKLYWVPSPLTKSSALAEVARRAGTSRLLTAGDSLLDLDMLIAADDAIAARHGELVTADAVPAGVTVTRSAGVLAGEEIVRWLAERA